MCERLRAFPSHIWFRRAIIGCLDFDRKLFRPVLIAHVTVAKSKISRAKNSLYFCSSH